MHGEHWGPSDGSGPRALLVHGITSSAATMWELGTGLADAGWSVTAMDLPGHGSSPPVSSYAFADVADAIHDEFGGGYDLYVGHSLGGAVGTVLLARHPDTARRAVLIDPALLAPAERLSPIPAQLEADRALGVADVAAANPHWHPRTVEARVEATQAADVEAVRSWLADNSPWDVTAAAEAVRVPVLVLVATTDSALAPFLVEQLPAANPHWSFETVPDTTHSVHRDQPALVLERLLMTVAWSTAALKRIDGADELQIAVKRANGTLRRWVSIWVVRVGGQVYVRTWYRREDGWFGHVLDSRRARIRVPGLEADVAVDHVGDGAADLRADVDAAYRAKYGSHGGTERMVTAEAAAATLRLIRCPRIILPAQGH